MRLNRFLQLKGDARTQTLRKNELKFLRTQQKYILPLQMKKPISVRQQILHENPPIQIYIPRKSVDVVSCAHILLIIRLLIWQWQIFEASFFSILCLNNISCILYSWDEFSLQNFRLQSKIFTLVTRRV